MTTEVESPDASGVPTQTAWMSRLKASRVLLPVVLFVGLLGVYHVNRTMLDEGDAVPNSVLPYVLLSTGGLSFTPENFPELFKWETSLPLRVTDDLFVPHWGVVIGGKTLAEWRQDGKLRLNKDRYYIVKSERRGVYLSTFGPVPGLSMLPLAALVHAVDSNFGIKSRLRLSVAKLHSASMTAGAALAVFFVGLVFTRRSLAAAVALAYGLGTCAWSLSSQNLWQQTVSGFFLCLGTLAFVKFPERPKWAALAGLAFGIAVASRSTIVLPLFAVFVYLAIYHRRSAVALALGCAPAPLALAAYNYYYFGNPLTLAQQLVGHGVATEKTGSPDLWQTPFFEGAAGLLFSPSRGLLVFSPFLILSFWGIFRIWRDSRYRVLRPLTIGALSVMALQCKWFDWWGGWTYGPRPWVDMIPLLTIFLVPVIETVWKHKPILVPFAAALGWSVFVQVVGAYSYDKTWNDRILHVVRVPRVHQPFAAPTQAEAVQIAKLRGGAYVGPTRCDIDTVYCRHRLWSTEDNAIFYSLGRFSEGRANRLNSGWGMLGGPLTP